MEHHVRIHPNNKSKQPLSASVPAVKEKWRRSVPAARIQWSRLTLDELLETEGDEVKLATLVQKRYDLTRDEADSAVAEFLSTCGNWS